MPFSCGHSTHNYQNYTFFSFTKGDQILLDAIRIGKQRATQVNPRDPSGNIRSPKVLEATNIRGALTELCTDYILRQEISNRMKNVQISQSDEMEDTIEGKTQVDLTLMFANKNFEIETRSSCVKNGIEFGIQSGYFNIVGWYSTASKPGETKKDFYLMYLFGFDAADTLNYLDNRIQVAFVGGASKSMLQGTLGSDETMKQTSASYRGINPICKAFDSQQILDEIFR